MESIISKLYHSELHPYQLLPHSEEYAERRKEQFRCSDTLEPSLQAISKDLTTQYVSVIEGFAELAAYESEEMFRAGVSLGLSMMAEAMGYEPKYFCDGPTL